MGATRILVVDDEQGVRTSLSAILGDEGFEVETAASGEECLAILGEKSYQAILLDVWLPGKDGLETLRAMRRMGVESAIIMISGHGTIDTAVRATRLGAHDFVEKPLSLEKILLTLRNALRARKLEERNRLLREELRRDTDLVGESAAIRRLREQIGQTAPTGAAVLVTGEPGTGKELVARAIHVRSPRSEEAFVEIPCAALPPESAVAELFGTAGDDERPTVRGKLDLAGEGTIFLDEVWALPADAQQFLLRALETGRFLPRGGQRAVVADARPIASTSRDLGNEVAQGRFRSDLWAKLGVIPLLVPPLRERREDVPLLVEHYAEKYAREYGRPRWTVEPAAMEALTNYAWPGNVRELRNFVERLIILAPGESIGRGDLPAAFAAPPSAPPDPASPTLSLKDGREAFEREMIRLRLESLGWNITRAAQSLGIERSNLHRKMKTYGIRPGPTGPV